MHTGTPNQYRGMLFGSTGRFGSANPTPMWEFWDQVAIQDTDMVGWWDPLNPITVNRTVAMDPFQGNQTTVLATAYIAPKVRTIIALASWSAVNETITLGIDWSVLGLDPAHVTVTTPAIATFQSQSTLASPTSPIIVEPGMGWLVVIEPTSRA